MRFQLLLLTCLLSSPVFSHELDEARALIQARRVPEALPLLTELQRKTPKDVPTLMLLGDCQLKMLDQEAAMTTAETLLGLAPNNAEVLAFHGSACLALAGRKSSMTYARKGRKSLEKALELDPNNLLALEMLIGFMDNAPFFLGGSQDKALELLKKMEPLAPEKAFAIRIGILAKAKGFDEALALCETRLKAFPEDYIALYEFGRLCGMADKRQKEGLLLLEQCLALQIPEGCPGYERVHYRMAVLERQRGDEKAANSHFDEALRFSTNDKAFAEYISRRR